MLTREPSPALRPFVKTQWASAPADPPTSQHAPQRELVLPTGAMHIVLRLTDAPLRLFDGVHGGTAHNVGTAIVGGARATFYVRDISQPAPTVGALLEPGMASLLLGVPADLLAGTHTPLDALWGAASVQRLREQLAEAATPKARLELFERLLLARLPRLRALNPAVAQGLARLGKGDDVAAAVRVSGYSHRRFTALFRAQVGLAPKLFCRVQRFSSALRALERPGAPSWSSLALAAGYSDQAHFTRDFREFSGLTPSRYRALAPDASHHVPLPTEPA